MKRKKVTIIGAGPSGLMCGAMLSRHFDVDIYEKTNSIGGRSKWSKLGDNYVDFGPHVLRYGEKGSIMQVFDIASIEKPECPGLSVSIYKGRKARQLISGTESTLMKKISLMQTSLLGPINRVRFIQSLLDLIETSKEEPDSLRSKTVTNWAEEKDLNRDVAEIFSILARATNTCPDKNNTSALELGLHLANGMEAGKTITYPIGGFGKLHEHLADKIKENGGNIYLNSKVNEILFEKNQASGIIIGKEISNCDYLVAAMPSANLWKSLVDKPNLLRQLNIEEVRNICSYLTESKKIKPNKGLCLDMIIDTDKYKDKSMVLHPCNELPSIMCIVSNTDKTLVKEGESYLTYLGLPNKDLNIMEYKSLAKFMINQVYPNIFYYQKNARWMALNVIDGAEVNVNQEQMDRPSSLIPGIDNFFNPSDDKKEGHSGGEEIAAGASISVYKKIMEREGYLF